MPWELADDEGNRYRVPAGIAPTQLHVGGRPDQRIVRAYGSSTWYSTLPGYREPEPFVLTGLLATDRAEAEMHEAMGDLRDATITAAALIHVDYTGLDVQYLPLLGSLPITTKPDGIDGTLLEVTIPLLPANEWQPGTPELGNFLLLDTGGIMLLDDGSKATQQ